MSMHIRFTPVDTWCFREARPMSSQGGETIRSVFPPPPSTLIGATRTYLGDKLGINWAQFADTSNDSMAAMRQLIGDAETTGELDFDYPFIEVAINDTWQRLYPVPSVLVGKFARGELTSLATLKLPKNDKAKLELRQTDLGNVCLLQAPALSKDDEQRHQSLQDYWLLASGLKKLTEGKLPDVNHLIKKEGLLHREQSLGIGRNHAGTSEDGMLFRVEHLRLAQNAFIEDVRVVLPLKTQNKQANAVLLNTQDRIRLGGEARMAQIEVVPAQTEAPLPLNLGRKKSGPFGLLYLLSPADFNKNAEFPWLLPTFKPLKQGDADTWSGEIAGIALTVLSMVAERPLAQGGWDQAKRCAKPVKHLVPEGACYLIHCPNFKHLEAALNSAPLGQSTAFGYGQLMLLPLL